MITGRRPKFVDLIDTLYIPRFSKRFDRDKAKNGEDRIANLAQKYATRLGDELPRNQEELVHLLHSFGYFTSDYLKDLVEKIEYSKMQLLRTESAIRFQENKRYEEND